MKLPFKVVVPVVCGTAAVITPIRRLIGEGGLSIDFGEVGPGALTMSLRDELTGIQYGTREDRHGWVETIVPAGR